MPFRVWVGEPNTGVGGSELSRLLLVVFFALLRHVGAGMLRVQGPSPGLLRI